MDLTTRAQRMKRESKPKMEFVKILLGSVLGVAVLYLFIGFWYVLFA